MLGIAASGRAPARDVVAVAWMNEGGSRFAPGMMGSAAFAGAWDLAEICAVRDAGGTGVGEALGGRVEALARDLAGPCAVAVRRMSYAASNAFDPALRARIATAAAARGHAALPVLSAAGHDARHLAGGCPSAVIFIPCRGGVSHAEHEWAEPAHVAAGAEVLADVPWELSCGAV